MNLKKMRTYCNVMSVLHKIVKPQIKPSNIWFFVLYFSVIINHSLLFKETFPLKNKIETQIEYLGYVALFIHIILKLWNLRIVMIRCSYYANLPRSLFQKQKKKFILLKQKLCWCPKFMKNHKQIHVYIWYTGN